MINLNEVKRCGHCRESKPINKFRIKNDKISNLCIFCEHETGQKSREKNRCENQLNVIKKCKFCRKDKFLNEMFKSASGWYRSYCKECYEIYIPEKIKQKDIQTREIRRINEREKRRKDVRISMIKAAKKRAKENNLSFNIIKEDIIIPEFCPVLGIKIQTGIDKMIDSSPTLDKIIPERGYVKDNICVISWRANTLKRDGLLHEFKKIVEYLSKYEKP